MTFSEHNLIWIDLEMTGLDTEHDFIIEIATIVTNSQLEIIAEGPVAAIYQPTHILENMDDWNRKQHRTSGLINRVQKSTSTEMTAQSATLTFLEKYVPAGKSPMCGNTVCQDRRFLHKHMPKLEKYFHYRHLDVTTLKILVERWAPKTPPFTKESSHLALEDIRDSIEELKHYRYYFIEGHK